ncbi:MAG: hypothetical protein KGM16_11070 [Bacteroidota bacterium]|nr:hypothetical protein [Bacteroidota bacterium]
MNSTVLDLKINTSDTLSDFENYNSQLKEEVSEVHLYLAKNFKRKFFNDAWISSLIAKASSGSRKLVVTEWGDRGAKGFQLGDSLIGVTSAYLADEIKNSKSQKIQVDVQQIIESIALSNKGMIDCNSSTGHTFTFCSFDSRDKNKYFPRPLALSAENINEFTDIFLKIKRDKIDKAFGIAPPGTSSLFEDYHPYQMERSFAALIYELYENTIQHGNKDESNNLVEGVRSFSIKRHTITNTDDFKSGAENFAELTGYMASISAMRNQKSLRFYEISIVDNGIGIIKRFVASRPDFLESEPFKSLPDFEKLNFIIDKSLSSKLFPGAGKGIKGALRNISDLKGFISLRTNDLWACYDGTEKVTNDNFAFKPVKTKLQLDNISGTCYNILIPVSPR